ncbi:hypothetical protein [Nonomuraea sp. NPDC049028]|uniref:hypothetical protein n=1 Tax=Nonomuraea sp. NPDC049028 TaxID=3364348 RepID=UPI0037164B0C
MMFIQTLSARFTSRLRSEQVSARLGMWLGISFTLAFATGLFSHFTQHPPTWLLWPSRPVNLYRVTQGLHVIGGIATVPLLLAKLWTVYPKLWQWPPLRSAGHAAERLFALLLAAGAALRAWLIVAGMVTLATLPTVLALGRRADNPSILPHDYALNLLIVLAGTGLVAAVIRLAGRLAYRRSPEPSRERSQ